jgi:hypothetical protein
MDLFHGVSLALVIGKEVVDRLSVGWGDSALLDEVVLLDDWVGILEVSVCYRDSDWASMIGCQEIGNSQPRALQCSCGGGPSAPG